MSGAWIPLYLALVIGLGIGFWLHSLLDAPVQAPPLPDAPLPMPGFPGAGYDADLRAESVESSKATPQLWERQIDDILSGKSRWHEQGDTK